MAAFLPHRIRATAADLRAIPRVRALEAMPVPRRRFIFHGAFGGSTLLSRLLDCPGKALAVREPNSLVDIVVFGRRGGKDMARYVNSTGMPDAVPGAGETVVEPPGLQRLRHRPVPRLDIVPATVDLSGAEIELVEFDQRKADVAEGAAIAPPIDHIAWNAAMIGRG